MSEPSPSAPNDPLSRLAHAIALANRDSTEDVPATLRELVEAARANVDEHPDHDRASTADPLIGAILGDFRIEREIGRGGMGVVYEARQRSLDGRRVALKVLPAGFALSPKRLARFQQEAQIGAKLRHSGLVTVYAVGSERGLHFIAHELVEGGRTLAEWVMATRERTDLTVDHYRDVARMFAMVADALNAAHDAGVIHRDLKPSNILLAPGDEPKIADFGLAKDRDALALSDTGEAPGTPCYKSPEQVDPRGVELDRRSDVFALGVTMFEALTCTRLFDGDSTEQIAAKILRQDAPDPRKLRARIPRDLALICLKAVEKERERRYPAMRDLADDLRAFLDRRPIKARAPTLTYRASRWISREPFKAILTLVLLVGIPTIAALSGYVFANREVMATGIATARANRIESALELGYLQLCSEVPNSSIGIFEQALTEDRTNIEAAVGACVAASLVGDPQRALGFLDRMDAPVQEPGALDGLRADVLRALGRTNEADELASRVVEPRTSISLFIEAFRELSQARRGEAARFDRAADLLHRSIMLASGARAYLYINLAFAAQRARNESLARLCAQALEARWSNSARAWCAIGLARQTWDAGGALTAYERAIAIDPKLALAYYDLGVALHDHGEHERAIASYRRALELQPNESDTLNNLGECLLDLDRPKEAVSVLRDATTAMPKNMHAQYNLGVALQVLGDETGAIAAYEDALTLAPDDVYALNNLGMCLVATGNVEAGAAQFERVIEIDPNAVNARLNLVDALAQAGRYEQAIDVSTRAVELDPNRPYTWRTLALALTDPRLLADKQDPERALEAACRALALAGGASPEYLETLARMLLANDEREAALATIDRACDLLTADPSQEAIRADCERTRALCRAALR